jgi:hypothetical protein
VAGASSRYRRTPIATFTGPDGTPVRYYARRFLPRSEDLSRTGSVQVQPGERLDLVAARALGDPLQFWRIADAQPAELDPFALTDETTCST